MTSYTPKRTSAALSAAQIRCVFVVGLAANFFVLLLLSCDLPNLSINPECILLRMRGGCSGKTKRLRATSIAPSPPANEPKAVLIVPYRDESDFLRLRMHISVLSQQQNFHILGISESNASYYRKAWLLNAGLKYAASVYHDDSVCFVSHDVDVLPDLSTVDYVSSCNQGPKQLCSELSCSGDDIPYGEYADGVVSLNRTSWFKINGYTDSVYDWAGSGDDLYWRLRGNGLLVQADDANGSKSAWALRKPESGKGKCECVVTTTHRQTHSYGDSKKIADRIFRMKLQKSDEWSYSGLSSMSYQVDQANTADQKTTILRVSKPSVVLHSGLLDHKASAKDSERQTVVLLFTYRDRKAHYDKMMQHLEKLRQTVYKSWDMHVYVVEQMNEDLFRKGW